VQLVIYNRRNIMGKGDTYRKVNGDKYRKSYDKIFGKKKKTKKGEKNGSNRDTDMGGDSSSR
jgi:hypothetical protein